MPLNSPRKEVLKNHVYGPVASRRLGLSLGVDIVPSKTCSLDCIYCQLGPSLQKTLTRKNFFSCEAILAQIQKAIHTNRNIDCITFSGSGEPTLNASLGRLIQHIKMMTDVPVAVLTNGTLLDQESVRAALQAANLVVPSLDAATQAVFERVNRPPSLLKIEKIIEELVTFRKEFSGRLWVEVLLVKGINDSHSHLKALKEALKDIRPDKVHLNTVVRPPAEDFAQPLGQKELKEIQRLIGENTEIIADFKGKILTFSKDNLERLILSMIRRRPVTLFDISLSLGKNQNELRVPLQTLEEKGEIKIVSHKGKTYYKRKGTE